MEKILKKLREEKFLELSSSSGLGPMPGITGLIITKNKTSYYYHKYFMIPDHLKDEMNLESISEGKPISEDVYLKLVKYINENIIGKSFEDKMIFDAGCNISGEDFNIKNHFNIYNDLKKIIGG
ncbi:MAG: hypothetical protein IKG27_00350 [Bacilli bacterium]|nr:hypothetical protein [Bacilli bacterium]